ncbi:MAG TPA: transcription antitermination factor NusB [Patescibacteria group bacterium]|nr:transcription antitermination factor NusB [Patescibacteria group bacterium]
MKSTTDPRHTARKLALSSIFCWLFSEINDEECLLLAQDLLGYEDADPDLTRSIIEGVKNNNTKIDNIIEISAPEWPLDKISKVDLVILRIAIYEIMFSKNVPEKVAIDEAVELAKEFGNDTSQRFVNGVLGSVVNYKKEQKHE